MNFSVSRAFEKPIVRAALGLTLTFAVAESAAETPPELHKLRAAFAAAVAGRNIAAMAALSRFPLTNEVYGAPKSIDRADFASSVVVNGYWDEADCLRTAPLEQDVREDKAKAAWFIACDHGKSIFHFTRDRGRWVYAGFETIGK
jgi:hypothetical protein